MTKRENKYRGKRIDNGEWAYGYLKRYDDGACEIMVSGERRLTNTINGKPFYSIYAVSPEVDPETVGEITGVPDKNNTEICEDDVATFLWEDKLINMLIGYKDGQFLAFPLNYPEGWPLAIAFIKERLEVIDNIHDNTRLLEVRP